MNNLFRILSLLILLGGGWTCKKTEEKKPEGGIKDSQIEKEKSEDVKVEKPGLDAFTQEGKGVGSPCMASSECASHKKAKPICARKVQSITFLNGYCTFYHCNLFPEFSCPEGSSCTEIKIQEASMFFCLKKCSQDQDCRVNEGYSCKEGVCRP